MASAILFVWIFNPGRQSDSCHVFLLHTLLCPPAYHFRKICADGRISDGCSQRNITAAMMHSESRELFQQFLCQHGNSFFPGIADTNNFFTSVAIEGDVILEAECGSKLSDCFQTFITGIMSPCIIDMLEIVNIDEHDITDLPARIPLQYIKTA